ncbi:hypothetical protein [Planomonospora parontospora]|uniref:hypothetical protein n=1 Tax=Planomonospora parontospora TaxID=58119 RepID=UPI001670A4E3|nr:hypothetical protein [Planomonospora parontospora]GGL37538.1 hypothetical protein GCM10014719_43350 [Planomonospora parontospora subsp. antibiotica]GII17570.1 hypothetical protein Ppa05_42960 [Planomonospora parontospora subsp. antibiotica]
MRSLLETRRFQWAIVAVIVVNAATLGAETSSVLTGHVGGFLRAVDRITLAVNAMDEQSTSAEEQHTDDRLTVMLSEMVRLHAKLDAVLAAQAVPAGSGRDRPEDHVEAGLSP